MTKRPLDPGDFSEDELRFAQRFRAARAKAGMSHERLADATGVAKSYISYVENLRVNPSLQVCMRLAKGLGVDLGDLTTSRHVEHLDAVPDD